MEVTLLSSLLSMNIKAETWRLTHVFSNMMEDVLTKIQPEVSFPANNEVLQMIFADDVALVMWNGIGCPQ